MDEIRSQLWGVAGIVLILGILVGVGVLGRLVYVIIADAIYDAHQRRAKKKLGGAKAFNQSDEALIGRVSEDPAVQKRAEEQAREAWLKGAVERRKKTVADREAREALRKAKKRPASGEPRRPAPKPATPEAPPQPAPPRLLSPQPQAQVETPEPTGLLTPPAAEPARTVPFPGPPKKRPVPPKPSEPPGEAPASWQVREFRGFRNLRVLGRGGFGDVFYAEGVEGLPVAIKALHASDGDREVAERLFRREARILRSLRSPSIPRLLSSHVDAHLPYFVMEYIDGLNLRKHVGAHGPITDARQLLDLANNTADALAEIHEKGYLHRDIKPQNVMASRTGFKLIDLGIGKDLRSSSSSGAGRIGTLAFMAPEYMNGSDATRATDVFSWGAMMGYAMTGFLPYGQHPEHVLMNRVSQGRLDNRFLLALDAVKSLGVAQHMLVYVAAASLRTDPAHRDMNFHEVLRVLKRLHKGPAQS